VALTDETRIASIRRVRRFPLALLIVPGALAIIAWAAPLAHTAENSTSSTAQNESLQSAPHLTAAEKERALTEFMRRDAAGEKIDPALLRAFIEAQNEGATSGIALGQTAPPFELKDQNGRTRTLKSLMGRNGVLLVFTRSADW